MCIYIYIVYIYNMYVYIYYVYIYIMYIYIMYIYYMSWNLSSTVFQLCKKQQPYLSPSCAQPTDAVDEMQVWAAWHGSNFLMFSKWRMYPTRWVYCVSVVLTVASFWCALFICLFFIWTLQTIRTMRYPEKWGINHPSYLSEGETISSFDMMRMDLFFCWFI